MSTIPLNEFVDITYPRPPKYIQNFSQSLKYRSLVLVYIIVKDKNPFNC